MGTSGSFRHFLWQVIKELHSTRLQILMSCPSSAAGVNKVGWSCCCCHPAVCVFTAYPPLPSPLPPLPSPHPHTPTHPHTLQDKYIFTPGPLTTSLEKLLIFFGQVIYSSFIVLYCSDPSFPPLPSLPSSPPLVVGCGLESGHPCSSRPSPLCLEVSTWAELGPGGPQGS